MTCRLTTLPNGFRIVTEHMPGLASAAVGVWVNAGARHERADQNGVAHFLEHMAFKGTARRSALQIAEEIEDVGGYINAYTSREMTAYYARVLAADVPLALDVIADIVLNPAFEPREVEVERGVILQEIGQALDTPDDVIFDWLQEAAYPAQAIGRPILGPSERVSSFGETDLRGFVAQHYGPGQMILAASGAVDHDRLVALAEGYFAHLSPIPQAVADAARFTTGERREVKSLEQAHFALAFEAPGYRDPDFYAAQVFTGALGGGMSSRLFQKLREEHGLCYTIFAQTGAYADTGMMTIYAGTGAGELTQLSHLTMDEMKRAAEDMSEAEVARARAQMKAGLLMGLESPSSRAERLARLLSIWGRVPDVSEAVARIDAVSVADVRGFAASMLHDGRAALALYGPVADAPRLSDLHARLAA
ncbi:M16 family metallopeptidase [Roseicitreum antarcticum]|uniref:Predicted Zn-dependent peptidase n=1 Tax=Roseicitreum antarcticum TaxID=564137 RepID=A0A1H2XMA2_9RHOB|nr:pitrilysin family protein [Roseicitreum antarcticum]SDW93584.1 Predicted Zn-dependent peptidase [Roseicitreum antarcticum]